MTTLIETPRLRLIPATPEHLEAALRSDAALARALGVSISETWPPEFIDERAYRYTLERIGEGPEQSGWWLFFIVLHGEPATVIGTAGFKGPPNEAGTVEVGYGIIAEEQRCGYATEATAALVEHAFRDARVGRVIAETLPELIASIGVLEKCGFRRVEESSAEGVIRFARERSR